MLFEMEIQRAFCLGFNSLEGLRDGKQACATILYRKSDISHANAWVWSNYQNKERCNEILKKFSFSWQYTEAYLAGVC